MLLKLCTVLIFSLAFLADGCGSKSGTDQKSTAVSSPGPGNTSESASNSSSPGSQTSTPVLDACALIQKSEIESVQHATLQGTVPSSDASNGLAISRCYYTVFSADGSKNLSIHLEVMQNDPKALNQNAVGALWKDRFEGAQETKKAEKPKSVAGIGDGAYWVGNNKIGALYALKKNKLVRISVGGADDEREKVDKSKVLVEKALRRLG